MVTVAAQVPENAKVSVPEVADQEHRYRMTVNGTGKVEGNGRPTMMWIWSEEPPKQVLYLVSFHVRLLADLI